MNELKVNLENLTDLERKQLTALLEKSQQKPVEKWQPKGGVWFVTPTGKTCRTEPVTQYADFGVEYQTEEQAKKARDAMRTHNRLLAWIAENDDGWVADWDNINQIKWTVCYNHSTKSYKVDCNSFFQNLGAVRMSESHAYRLCKLLNDGVVEL